MDLLQDGLVCGDGRKRSTNLILAYGYSNLVRTDVTEDWGSVFRIINRKIQVNAKTAFVDSCLTKK
jgi:hypothetical protein